MIRIRRRVTSLETLETRRMPAAISVAPVQVVEADIPTQAAFTATLNQASTEAVTLTYATANGTARAGKDFTATKATITIPAGQTSATFSVPILASNVSGKANESFSVDLEAGVGNTVGSRRVAATIVDGNAAPTITASDLSLEEPASGRSEQGLVALSLSNPSAKAVRISYTTVDGTAVSSGKAREFQAESGTATIPPGSTVVKIPVRIFGNAADDQAFNVTLRSATNATLSAVRPGGIDSRVVIQDFAGGTARPTISVTNPGVPAGSPITFTVSLSNPSTAPVSLRYATEAASASPSQFTAVNNVLTIPAGQTTANITVPTTPNPLSTGSQYFLLKLSSPANATLAEPFATGTIIGTSTRPPSTTVPDVVVSAGTATVGTSGSASLPFTVTLSSPSTSVVTVGYSTLDGSGSAGIDFTGTAGTLTFAPGVTTQAVDVTVNGETPTASSKTVRLLIADASNSIITSSTAVGIIHYTTGQPTVSVSSASATVGNSGTAILSFTVALSAASAQEVTVDFATADGTAVAGTDYITHSGAFVIPVGATTQTIFIFAKGESTSAASKTLVLNLSNITNSTNTKASGLGTILYTNMA